LFQPDIMSPAEEEEFLGIIRRLSFGPFIMHGAEAKRGIANFGLRYARPSRTLTSAPEFPAELEPMRIRAASLAGIAPDEFAHLLVNEYQPGTGIGWHPRCAALWDGGRDLDWRGLPHAVSKRRRPGPGNEALTGQSVIQRPGMGLASSNTVETVR
jgi:hypothetical protein